MSRSVEIISRIFIPAQIGTRLRPVGHILGEYQCTPHTRVHHYALRHIMESHFELNLPRTVDVMRNVFYIIVAAKLDIHNNNILSHHCARTRNNIVLYIYKYALYALSGDVLVLLL